MLPQGVVVAVAAVAAVAGPAGAAAAFFISGVLSVQIHWQMEPRVGQTSRLNTHRGLHAYRIKSMHILYITLV